MGRGSRRPARIVKTAARLLFAAAALAVVAAMAPTGSAALFFTTDNPGNSFSVSPDFNTNPSFRVTTYEITGSSFSGTTYTLTLNQNLVADYFVLLRGAAGDYTSNTDRGPDADYARIDRDPFSNFGGGSSSANQLRLKRGAATGNWTGQVTVVECINDCAASGFTLVRVNEVTMTAGSTSASINSGGSWGGGIGQIGAYGGSYGGGMETTATAAADHKTGWARIWPQGGNKINLSRSNTPSGNLGGTTIFSIYVVQWGDEWTIQRATVTGSAGGDAVDVAGEYNTASISSVESAHTFVLAYGQVDSNTLSAGWEGHTWTLGNGTSPVPANATTVAVGAETGAQREVEVYVHTHPTMGNQWIFSPDGTGIGIISGNVSGTVTIADKLSPETHTSSYSAGRRFVIVANTSNGATTNYPRPIVWGQLTADTQARWQRSRSGEPGAYWMQAPDFGDIGS
jgi:hypothetical protein